MAKTRTFFTSQEAYVRPHEGSKRHDDEVNVRAIALLETPHRFIDRQVGGANPKGVLITGNPERPDRSFIAKRPRAWLRECATEAILGTIASTLPIRIARFRLVQLPTSQGVRRSKRRQWRVATGVHFLSEVFLKPGEALVHGVEIAARFLESNPDDIREVFGLGPKNEAAERAFYTVEAIVPMLEAISRDEAEFRGLVRDFGKMVVFDAFVGVQDRHAENWGVIECTLHPDRPLRFAPLYDTARGLFVSHGDQKLEMWDDPGTRALEITRYAERSLPLFGFDGDNAKPNHFELLGYVVNRLPNHFLSPAGEIVGAIRMAEIEKRLRIAYTRVVTRRRLECIIELLRYREARVRQIVFPRVV